MHTLENNYFSVRTKLGYLRYLLEMAVAIQSRARSIISTTPIAAPGFQLTSLRAYLPRNFRSLCLDHFLKLSNFMCYDNRLFLQDDKFVRFRPLLISFCVFIFLNLHFWKNNQRKGWTKVEETSQFSITFFNKFESSGQSGAL